MVVTPMEVVKIRLQAQRHSMMDPLEHPKYRNAAHAVYTIVKEEGVGALYKGVALTALRQATNQAVNFTAYQEFKKLLIKYQPDKNGELPSWQHLLIGGVSGAFGPLSNAPIDTIKTRIQRAPNPAGESGWTRFLSVTNSMIKNEGYLAFYKGLTPRLLRVAPGQAITFMVYERVRKWIEHFRVLQEEAKHDGKTLVYFKR
jgi:solute carrier family 25 citrate transporter 1